MVSEFCQGMLLLAILSWGVNLAQGCHWTNIVVRSLDNAENGHHPLFIDIVFMIMILVEMLTRNIILRNGTWCCGEAQQRWIYQNFMFFLSFFWCICLFRYSTEDIKEISSANICLSEFIILRLNFIMCCIDRLTKDPPVITNQGCTHIRDTGGNGTLPPSEGRGPFIKRNQN